MKKHSAGLVVYRLTNNGPEVVIAHMGSPWWAKKDAGAWTIPKGIIEEDEAPLEAAKREFSEELGLAVPDSDFIELGSIDQHNNKTVEAWALKADIDVSIIKSNTVQLEWPPRSGKMQDFPEIDRAGWFNLAEAAQKTVRGQAELFERLASILNVSFETQTIAEPPEQKSLF